MNDDSALAGRAAQGDQRAFALLVARHEVRLRGFLARVAGAAAAEDLAQETFLRAWRDAPGFRNQGSYQGWLLRIGWRLFIDGERSRNAERRRERESGAAHHAASEAEARVDAATVLAALDPAERACLLLCLGYGWSQTEAAAILDMPLGSVKTRVARATARARAMLEA